MTKLPWRDILIGLTIAAATAAVGSAVDVRDRVQACEIRERGRDETRQVRDADMLRRLERIENKLDKALP